MKTLVLVFMVFGTVASEYKLIPTAAGGTHRLMMPLTLSREKDCENHLKIMIYITCEDRCLKGTYDKLLAGGCKATMDSAFIKQACCPHHS